MYAWGDNEHGQQGNGSTICNRKPQQIMSLKDHRITKIACGSSHSLAFATGTPASAGEFTPISFQTTQVGGVYVDDVLVNVQCGKSMYEVM